jgi:type III secretion protein J
MSATGAVRAPGRSWTVFVLLLALALAGCERSVDLLSRLSEQDANASLKVLRQHGIDASKKYLKEGVALQVAPGDTVAALSTLSAYGLPRGATTSIGEVFKRDGMVSSPLEERARYVHALSKEIESIIEEIDGVIVARVLVVLGERSLPGSVAQPPSASVFVKYREEFDPDLIRPQIARLVGSAVPGLTDAWREHVTVVFIRAFEGAANTSAVSSAGAVAPQGPRFRAWSVVAGVVVTLLVPVAVWGWRRFARPRSDAQGVQGDPDKAAA